MSIGACATAICKCSFGSSCSSLMVPPVNGVNTNGMPMATIMDHAPLVNIMPFGLCSSLSNPTVASATAAKLGILTPMPCIPATLAPWTSETSTVLIDGKPILSKNSKLLCRYSGVVSISFPGQTSVNV